MPLNKDDVSDSLQKWSEALGRYSLPHWDDFPGLPLYMDQVIILLNQYLYPEPAAAHGDHAITPAMINNYVKLKIIPSPVKKRYSRTHLAYLVMVCIFKQTLSISAIPHLLPRSLNADSVKSLYNAFVDIYQSASRRYMDYVAETARPILEQESSQVTHLLMQLAVSANLSKMLTEQLVALEEASVSHEKKDGEKEIKN